MSQSIAHKSVIKLCANVSWKCSYNWNETEIKDVYGNLLVISMEIYKIDIEAYIYVTIKVYALDNLLMLIFIVDFRSYPLFKFQAGRMFSL